MTGLQRAGNDVVYAASGQDIETMYEGQVYDGLYYPVILSLRGSQNDLCLLGIIR